jgi:hypothetical protein
MGVISSKRNRDGVALILVVGMLALLMVMGVSFAIFMRTERIAAGNFRNDVQARQLLHVALARAIGDIEFHASVTNAHYPEWLVLASSNAVGNVVSNSAWATNYIPWGAVDGSLSNVQWVDVGQAGCSGRIAYACINASGLLDINYAGAGDRAAGSNAVEIQIKSLPDIKNNDPANAQSLAALRVARPFETIQDINNLGNAYLDGSVKSFITYSANPKSYPNGAAEPWVDIGGDISAPAQKTGIVAALKASVRGANDADADFMYNTLLDYVDTDSIPKNLASPCTELVPMINEAQVYVTNTFFANSNFTVTANAKLEWFYPFVKTSTNTYYYDYKITFTATNGTPLAFVPAPIVGTAPISSPLSFGQPQTISRSNFKPPASYVTPDLRNQPCQLGVAMILKIREGASTGPVVDESPSPDTALPLTFVNTTCRSPASVMATNVGWFKGAEVVDPRFNWDCTLSPPAKATQWKPYFGASLGSPGNYNSSSTNGVSGDSGFEMYVADGPIQSPAELTYLLRGISSSGNTNSLWRTIRLTDDPVNGSADTILDYFMVGSSNDVRHGVVNPNTRSEQVMKSLLLSMPLDRYPGEGGIGLDDGAATRLASWWMTAGNIVCGSISNLSQIGQMTNVYSDVVFSSKTSFGKEAFFRNLAGLFGVRQNYFVILLYAQAIKVTPDGQQNASAECRAVAEVWRDARPNAEGKHPCKVRLLKILPNP